MSLRRIIGTLCLALAVTGAGLLAGCSSVRLAYGNAPQLAWWWLDGYVDFSRDQAPAARQAIDGFFDWHRSTQLAGYLPLLKQAQAQVLEPTTAAQVCRWEDDLSRAAGPTFDKALAMGADLVGGFGEAQFKSLEKRYAKGNTEMREEYLQPDPAERQTQAFKRALERAERLYGSLSDAQKRVLREGLATSPFDPELWLAERQRRQRDVLATLRKLVADRAAPEQRVAALRSLSERTQTSPDPAYRTYQKKLSDYNCAFAAQLHNSTTVAQRREACERLKGWEDDLKVLAAGG